jgi:hypothetical protein
MTKITLLALLAAAIISAEGRQPRASISILAITRDPAIATTTTAPGTGTGNGIEGNVTEIAGTEVTVGSIGQGDIRPSTDAKTAGPFKTVSANRIEDIRAGWGRPAPPRLGSKPVDETEHFTSTTLADLLTPLLAANPFPTMRASLRR